MKISQIVPYLREWWLYPARHYGDPKDKAINRRLRRYSAGAVSSYWVRTDESACFPT